MQGSKTLCDRLVDLGPTCQQDADLIKWDHADNAVCQFPLQRICDAFRWHFSSVHKNLCRSTKEPNTEEKCYITEMHAKQEDV
jgi:hypothetical protein